MNTETRILEITALMQALSALRHRKQWSRAECAKRIGVTERALRSWEEGARTPKPIVQKVVKDFVKRN